MNYSFKIFSATKRSLRRAINDRYFKLLWSAVLSVGFGSALITTPGQHWRSHFPLALCCIMQLVIWFQGTTPPAALHKLASSVWVVFLLNWGQNPPLQWQQFETDHGLITNKHFLLSGSKRSRGGIKQH